MICGNIGRGYSGYLGCKVQMNFSGDTPKMAANLRAFFKLIVRMPRSMLEIC